MTGRRRRTLNKSVTEAIKYTFMGSIEFERGMMQILGQEAHHSVDAAAVPSEARKLLLKATRKLRARLDEIVTVDSRLRERLLSDFEDLEVQVKAITKTPSRTHIIGTLFTILSRLLGYDWMDGQVYRTPFYFRTKSQEYDDHIKHMRQWRDWVNEDNQLVLDRRKVCQKLKEEGKAKNRIARVLNVSEYEVEEMITDHHLAEAARLIEEGHTWDEVISQTEEGGTQRFLSLLRRREAAARRRAI